MHDTVIQGCTSISALLEAISSLRRENLELQENLLDHARMQVRSTIDEARQAVWNLRHKEDSVADLGSSAAAIAARTSKEFGIAVGCVEEGRPFRVRGSLARELLMVIREAVYNGALHGRPQRIQIKLVYTRDELSSSVSDDGCGFDPAARRAEGGATLWNRRHAGTRGAHGRPHRHRQRSRAGDDGFLQHSALSPAIPGCPGQHAAMSDEQKIKILICDDHPIMRFGIAAIIQSQPNMTVAAQAGTAAEAIRLFWEHRPDITLMDLRLPDRSGVEVIREVRRAAPQARFIVLTTYEGDEDIHQALEAGAMGYLIKGMPHEALMEALRKVHAGRNFLPPPVTRALASRMPDGELSTREREVLSLLVRGKSNREIADELSIKEATVKSHVSVILMRLECGRSHPGGGGRFAARPGPSLACVSRLTLLRYNRHASQKACLRGHSIIQARKAHVRNDQISAVQSQRFPLGALPQRTPVGHGPRGLLQQWRRMELLSP